MSEALALMWWIPGVIVIGCLIVIFVKEYHDWKRRGSWYLPDDPAVYRPRAYVDQRGETPDPRQDLPALLRRQAS